MMNKQELIDFEKEIASIYSQGKINGPIHLAEGNEDFLIDLFKNVSKDDWVFSSYRNHYHALLKGMPPEKLKENIIRGDSMYILNKENKIYTSSIVCGQIPAAVGTALALKRKNKPGHVYAFCGDMASEMGVFYESLKYSNGHNLPITFIVEDNGLGVYTNTKEVWGGRTKHNLEDIIPNPKVKSCSYQRKTYSHHGSGVWVDFPTEHPKDPQYKGEVNKAMKLLGEDPRTIFIGQTVGIKGSPIYNTLEGVSLEKRIELPIMEEVQAGMSIGLALEDYVPVSIYPRFDFLILATNQIVNHLDKISELSRGNLNPKVITRTMIGGRYPLCGGAQHSQDHTQAFKQMLTNTEVKRLENSSEIVNSYKAALNSNKPSLIVEISDLYN